MTLDELIQNAEGIPPAPQVLPKLVEIVKNSDVHAEDIVAILSVDPSIVANTLKLSNSALYAPPAPITSLKEAVAMLGISEVYRVVNRLTSSSYLESGLPSLEIGKGGLWMHSLAVAMIMELIADEHSRFEGMTYTLGLLHDIGKIAMHHGCGEHYQQVFELVESKDLSINAAEVEILGFDHAQAGSKMLEAWNFPPEVYLPIRYQYNPKEAEEFKHLAGALQVASWAAAAMGCNDGRDAWALNMDPDVFHIDERSLENAILEGRLQLDTTIRSLGKTHLGRP